MIAATTAAEVVADDDEAAGALDDPPPQLANPSSVTAAKTRGIAINLYGFMATPLELADSAEGVIFTLD